MHLCDFLGDLVQHNEKQRDMMSSAPQTIRFVTRVEMRKSGQIGRLAGRACRTTRMTQEAIAAKYNELLVISRTIVLRTGGSENEKKIKVL